MYNSDSAVARSMPVRLQSACAKAVAIIMAALLACTCLIGVMPTEAFAMGTVKCTAKTNSDSGSNVQGAKETRVTWEGQADPTEILTGLSFTFPEGAEFGIDDARVTVLSGADMMTRDVLDSTITKDGQTLNAVFPAAPAGSYFRIEIYEVVFPSSGGDMAIAGAYTLKDGTIKQMNDVPAITVAKTTAAESLAYKLENKTWVMKWNSSKFLRLFFNPALIVRSIPVVFHGFLMALGIVLCAFPCAIPLGLLLSLMRMSKFRVLRAIGSVYVNVVRGTPLFLQIYVAFFGLPLAGVTIPNFPLGVIVLSMNSAAYLCEIFRAGIQSIPKGQTEASRSLGMNGAQTMIFVIIPQTVRRVIPTMTSEFILLYKDTSLLAAVGVMEVVQYAKSIVAATGSITPYIVAALFYLLITLPLAKVVGNLERKMDSNVVKKSKSKSRNSFGFGRKAAAATGAGEVLLDAAEFDSADAHEAHEAAVAQLEQGYGKAEGDSSPFKPENYSSM